METEFDLDSAESEASCHLWWTAPDSGFIKLNVDGSFLRHSKLMATGGIWLGGFSSKEGCGSVLQVELNAIIKGLSLAWDMGWKRVVCESDSLEAIHLIHLHYSPPLTTYRSSIQEI
ncbi:Ribonuclease H-like superfamily [Sesbania bispinosa]|nr:Ribonuclease H-like superfamily [Sesbania bispinosa]